MEKLKTITLTTLLTFLTFGIITLYSCDREPKGGDKIELTIHNPYDFEVRLEIEGVLDCDPDKNPNYDSFSPPHKPLYPAPAHLACIVPNKGGYWHLNLGLGTMKVTTDLGVRKVKIKAYDYKDKDTKGGEEVGELSFKGKFGKKYEWTVGYNNSVEEIVPPPPSSGGGSGSGGSGSGSGNCPGAEAQKYKDLLTNSPSNGCSQIWAQQAAWHAYKCNCDRGMASASDANKMVATLNAARTAIENLYKSGGSGPYTKCGAIPPKVTKCNVL